MQKITNLREMNPSELDEALMKLESNIEKAYVLLTILQQQYGFDGEEMTKKQAMYVQYYAKDIYTMFGVIGDYIYNSLKMLKGGVE